MAESIERRAGEMKRERDQNRFETREVNSKLDELTRMIRKVSKTTGMRSTHIVRLTSKSSRFGVIARNGIPIIGYS